MIQSSAPLGKLIIFSAPSGAGKTTIVKHLMGCGLNLKFSVSATSRKPRKNEINGKDYYFISEPEFRKKIHNNEFLEWEEVYSGSLYGTLKSEVEKKRLAGDNVIFDIDVVGGLNIKQIYGGEALAVFVKPPSVEELRRRLSNRSTETQDIINMRIDKAEHELNYATQFDCIIVNDNIQEAFKEAESVVKDFISG